MKKKQILLLILAIVIIIFTVFRKHISYEVSRKINVISAGSYPYAEAYYLNYSESEVKQALRKFKTLYPKYNVPGLDDHQTENPAFWYITYFYLQNENEVLYTFTRENGKNETTFAFVQVKKIGDNSWKSINQDFNYTENKMKIEKFENRILKVLKSILKKDKAAGNSGFAP